MVRSPQLSFYVNPRVCRIGQRSDRAVGEPAEPEGGALGALYEVVPGQKLLLGSGLYLMHGDPDLQASEEKP